VSAPSGKPPLWAVLGTVVFVFVLPGTVMGWMPYWLSAGWRMDPPLLGTPVTRWVGAALFLAATPIFLAFLGRFVFEGHGTPAPLAPTRHLVVGGPFRWVRNPGYIAVLAMIIGQGLFLGSPRVLAYAMAVAGMFHFFVVGYEEPTLRRTYGAEFEAYCRRVPRWIPRRPGGS
jgi:protein-S-isoprenylcysteine O-methyltransferase Ste14